MLETLNNGLKFKHNERGEKINKPSQNLFRFAKSTEYERRRNLYE